jgi:hypothetical protein
MPKSRDGRAKAVKAHLAAVEAVTKALKLQAAGNLEAAHEAMQSAIRAVKGSLDLQHPWSAEEQHELEAILRGGVRSDSEEPLGDLLGGPSADDARDRVQQAIGWHKAIAGKIESRSNSGRQGAAERDDASFNREIEQALAEIELPTKKGERRAAAEKHLKVNHLNLWEGDRRAGRSAVKSRVASPWFQERMRQSQALRANRLRATDIE